MTDLINDLKYCEKIQDSIFKQHNQNLNISEESEASISKLTHRFKLSQLLQDATNLNELQSNIITMFYENRISFDHLLDAFGLFKVLLFVFAQQSRVQFKSGKVNEFSIKDYFFNQYHDKTFVPLSVLLNIYKIPELDLQLFVERNDERRALANRERSSSIDVDEATESNIEELMIVQSKVGKIKAQISQIRKKGMDKFLKDETSRNVKKRPIVDDNQSKKKAKVNAQDKSVPLKRKLFFHAIVIPKLK